MKKNYIWSLLFLTLFTTGCEDFLDVNEDLDSPYTSTPNYLLPAVLANFSTSIFDHGETESYFTQQLATMSGFDKYKDRWDYVTANRIAQWRRHYHDISSNAHHVIIAAQREGATNYEGVATIIYAFSTQITTDVFGDMPFSEALEGNPSPAYDEQAYIYEQILELLDRAIELLEKTDPETVRTLTSKEDNIYGGNLQSWIRLAYAVKARTLLHLTPHVNQNYDEIIAAADNALDGWENAYYDYSVGNTNSLQINQWGPSKADPGWDYANNILDKSAPGEFFVLRALAYDEVNGLVTDPRQPLLMKPNAEGDYLYIVPGEGKIPTLNDSDYPDLYGSYLTQDYAPMPLFTEEELHFIKAEAYFNSGDKSNALTSFRKAIEANMATVGVTEPDAQAFLNGPTVPQTQDDLNLSHIMMQKYVALYLQGEVWVDMRRHNYSDQVYLGLKRPGNLASYWNEVNDGEWIERLPYDTETEEIYNKPLLEALGAYQNPEWLKKPLMWAK